MARYFQNTENAGRGIPVDLDKIIPASAMEGIRFIYAATEVKFSRSSDNLSASKLLQMGQDGKITCCDLASRLA